MKTRTWILLLSGLLVLSLAAAFLISRPGEAAAFAQITSDGQVIATVDLHVDQELTVQTPQGGENVITVRDGSIAVTQANCPDGYCMDRGYCSGGTQIVCLPNRLVIRFLRKAQVDGVAG